jgi:hypothetical protein
MRLRLLAAATAAAVVAIVLPSSAAHASHAWGNYHWARTSNPFTVRLDNNVTSAWTSYLNTASSDWTASTVLNTTVVSGSFGSKTSCTPTTGHVEVCNAAYGSTGWLGVASISITTGNHISSGSVKINDTYFNRAQYNTVPYKHLVMCQEVGHTFGLAHQDENQTNTNLGSCMDYSNHPAGPPSNEHPNSHDYAQLVTIYSHTDSFSTPRSVAAAEAPAPALAGDSEASWGEQVSGQSHQGAATYVRDYGNGTYTVTHVLWV